MNYWGQCSPAPFSTGLVRFEQSQKYNILFLGQDLLSRLHITFSFDGRLCSAEVHILLSVQASGIENFVNAGVFCSALSVPLMTI